MSDLSLMPVPAEQAGAACANCGAALDSDQRYCLECGQPASPVRLAFLDVLQAEQNASGLGPSLIEVTPASYVAVDGQQSVSSWLRRNTGLLGLLCVLLMCLIVGLLVGHWVTQGKAPGGPTVVKVEGLSPTAPAAAGTTPTSTAATSTTPSSSTASKSPAKENEEAKTEAKETAAEEAPPPKPVELSAAKAKKLSTSTGKQHEEEVNALGDQPTISH